jgi:hypothetical protein
VGTALFTAFAGALVGFGGALLLQSARFRREDRAQERRLAGIARALVSELQELDVGLREALELTWVFNSARFNVTTWSQLHADILGHLPSETVEELISAYREIAWINSTIATANPAKERVSMEYHRLGEAMSRARISIETAIDGLLALAELDAERIEMPTPWYGGD